MKQWVANRSEKLNYREQNTRGCLACASEWMRSTHAVVRKTLMGGSGEQEDPPSSVRTKFYSLVL